jgi:uncharacterized protein (DUF58 family)
VSPVRLRKRAAGLLFGAGVVFLMGTNAQAGWLLGIAALLVGAVLAGMVLPLAGLRGVRAELVAPDEATQGDLVYVDVRIELRGRGVRWGLSVRDAHLAETVSFIDVVRAAERVEITTERSSARRGRRRTDRLEVRTAAPFGVAERRRILEVDAETLVLPSVVPLGALPFVDPVGTAEPAVHDAPRRGHGPEYLGIREYRTGDSMRHVHWASTARQGAVMVREFEEEQTRRLLVVVDTERDEPAGERSALAPEERARGAPAPEERARGAPAPDERAAAEPTPLDRCCTAAASLTASALAHGHGSRLAAATADGVDVIARSEGRELFRWLAELTPSEVPLDAAIAELPVDATRGAETVVLVAPAWASAGARSLVDAVGALTDHVPRVVCVLVGTAPIDRDDPALTEVGASLVAAGAEVCPWPAGGDLAAIVGAAP